MKVLKNPEHIRYYRILEDDLERTFRYVDPDQQEVYSDEFSRIILAAATEVENVLREFAAWANAMGHQGVKARNILTLTAVVTNVFPKFATMQMLAPSILVGVHPWNGLSKKSAPDWWTNGYNKIKHSREENKKAPTLRRAWNAVAALQVVLLHYYRLKYGRDAMLADSAIPRLFVPWDPGAPEHESAHVMWQFDLPDDLK